MPTPKAHKQIVIPEDMHRQLRRRAVDEDKTLAQLSAEIVRKGMDAPKRRYRRSGE